MASVGTRLPTGHSVSRGKTGNLDTTVRLFAPGRTGTGRSRHQCPHDSGTGAGIGTRLGCPDAGAMLCPAPGRPRGRSGTDGCVAGIERQHTPDTRRPQAIGRARCRYRNQHDRGTSRALGWASRDEEGALPVATHTEPHTRWPLPVRPDRAGGAAAAGLMIAVSVRFRFRFCWLSQPRSHATHGCGRTFALRNSAVGW